MYPAKEASNIQRIWLSWNSMRWLIYKAFTCHNYEEWSVDEKNQFSHASFLPEDRWLTPLPLLLTTLLSVDVLATLTDAPAAPTDISELLLMYLLLMPLLQLLPKSFWFCCWKSCWCLCYSCCTSASTAERWSNGCRWCKAAAKDSYTQREVQNHWSLTQSCDRCIPNNGKNWGHVQSAKTVSLMLYEWHKQWHIAFKRYLCTKGDCFNSSMVAVCMLILLLGKIKKV